MPFVIQQAPILCYVIFALGAAGIEKSQVRVKVGGLIVQRNHVNQNDVVRREKKTVQVGKVSMFAGLMRMDTFSAHTRMNCSSEHGGSDLGDQMLGKTLKACKKACSDDDDCTCISHEPSMGICSKQKNCYLEDCVPSSLVHTYQLHSTFKLNAKKAKAIMKLRKGEVIRKVTSGESFDVQEEYDRSGGRDCSADGPADNATIIHEGHYDSPRSVVQCLEDCNDDANCTCVKFERYYQQACTLMSDCGLPNFCSRAEEYDMYVLSS